MDEGEGGGEETGAAATAAGSADGLLMVMTPLVLVPPLPRTMLGLLMVTEDVPPVRPGGGERKSIQVSDFTASNQIIMKHPFCKFAFIHFVGKY